MFRNVEVVADLVRRGFGEIIRNHKPIGVILKKRGKEFGDIEQRKLLLGVLLSWRAEKWIHSWRGNWS